MNSPVIESKKILAKTKNMKNYSVFTYAYTRINISTNESKIMYVKKDSGLIVNINKLEVAMKL